MAIADARDALQRAALAFAADQTPGNARQLEAEARDFSKAQIDAATGVTAAKFQADQEKKIGARLCPSCMQVKVVHATSPHTPSRWLDAKTFKPHFCRST
jgi:hypothetical protein